MNKKSIMTTVTVFLFIASMAFFLGGALVFERRALEPVDVIFNLGVLTPPVVLLIAGVVCLVLRRKMI